MPYLIIVLLCLVIVAMFCLRFFERKGLWFFLGFVAYPLLFVPVGMWFFPRIMDQWIHIYADYLRLWGF
jgi:cytochrome bd-type quinol oxidase subunit 2